jgi:predicted PurR-regulated permease PerM
MAVVKTLLVPLLVASLFFYIIRPLNNIFLKKGMGAGKASLLTLTICSFILSGLIYYFSQYAYEQFKELRDQLMVTIHENKDIEGIINYINQFINNNEVYTLAVGMAKNYIQKIGHNFMRMLGYFMNTFSMVFLIIVIVFYMLKDGHMFKERVLYLIPNKYKSISGKLLSESDVILSHYVIGQAKVALSLSIMIFIGYKVIGLPNAMILSTITFILAFIPFVGFFISMIIPIVISLGIGIIMFGKLLVLFIIVQTLKGRVVVPAIMAKSMNIHPLTDIFLVIGAIAVAGPFAAFAVVPIYAIVKNVILVLKEDNV